MPVSLLINCDTALIICKIIRNEKLHLGQQKEMIYKQKSKTLKLAQQYTTLTKTISYFRLIKQRVAQELSVLFAQQHTS